MKKYIIPQTTEIRFASTTVMFADSGANGMPMPGGVPAAKRMENLGNTSVKSSLGSLGSTGSIRSIGTLK